MINQSTVRTASHQRMLTKAVRLEMNGYKTVEVLERLYEVTSVEGATYVVDTRDGTCDCPAYTKGLFRDQSGACTCKHLEGMRSQERRARVMKNINLDF